MNTLWVIRAVNSQDSYKFLAFDSTSDGYPYWSENMWGIKFYSDYQNARADLEKCLTDSYYKTPCLHYEISEISFIPHFILHKEG